MNLSEAKDYLIEMDFDISEDDIKTYDQDFNRCCEMLRECNEIISKESYTDEELLSYTIKVMAYMFKIKNDLIGKIHYLLHEGFLQIDCAGSISPSDYEEFELSESDFSNVEK